MSVSKPARYWLGTCYCENAPELAGELVWIKGQREKCPTTDRLHWQLLIGLCKPQRLSRVKQLLCRCHWEPSRSDAAERYVWKEDTRVPDTQFELGQRAVRRNNSNDWESILQSAKSGNFDAIPPDIYIRFKIINGSYYRSLTCISADHAEPIAIERTVFVFWGRTGTGKSKRAWEEAGVQAYSKDPRTKWWDGYKGEKSVVIDEFRGTVDISHVLRWLDRYPVRVECKGSSRPLLAETVWITSNLDPRSWYPDLDAASVDALLRRLTNIIEFP